MSISTKDKIIDVAKELFSQKGFYETRVSDIVNKADVAQGTFYIYFKSKEDLFLELIKKLHHQLIQRLSTHKNSNKDFETTIKSIITDFLTEVYKNREIAQIFFGQLLGINEEFRRLYITKISDIQQIFKEVIEKYYDDENSQVLATMLLGFLRQLFFNCLTYQNLSLDDMIDRAFKGVDIILAGLKQKEEKVD